MIVKKNIQFWLKYFPALTSGFFLTLSFPDTGLSYLAFFALVPLLVSIQSMTYKESFYAGFITGIFYFLTLIYWIVPTIHLYGGLHLIFAVGVLILLCLYLALYPAIFSFTLKNFSFPKTNIKPDRLTPGNSFNNLYRSYFIPLFAALLWSGLEYIRTYAFTGFAWGTLGYSQFNNLNLIQIADVTGVYGVSFLIVLVNSSLALLWISFQKELKQQYVDMKEQINSFNSFMLCCVVIKQIRHMAVIPIIYTIALVAVTYLYGSLRINDIDSKIKTAQTTKISIVPEIFLRNDMFKFAKTPLLYRQVKDTP